jgi:glycosyltransferase involved in cell wall biosynthesis
MMPAAFANFSIGDTDLILSSSHCAAKGLRKPEGAVHVCFCYSPMRYVWDLYETYLEGMRGITRYMFKQFAPKLRKWDKASSKEVDVFIAISDFIADRIKRVYERDSVVVYPPIDCNRFTIDERVHREEHFLVLSRLVSYKRVDLAIEAFKDLPFKLRIVGSGPQADELKAMAGSNVEFAGFIPEDELVNEYRRARAVIVTAIEDFGLVPLEAAACGTPTIAYGHGGYLETVRDGVSGVFFPEQEPASLTDAVNRFHKMQFDPIKIREAAMPFDIPRFKREIEDVCRRALGGFTT